MERGVSKLGAIDPGAGVCYGEYRSLLSRMESEQNIDYVEEVDQTSSASNGDDGSDEDPNALKTAYDFLSFLDQVIDGNPDQFGLSTIEMRNLANLVSQYKKRDQLEQLITDVDN